MSSGEQRRQLSLEEMAAADAAPRLTLLAVLCLGASALALLQLSSTTPWSVVLAPVIRPVAWVGVIGGLVLVAAAARAWARALRDRTGYAGTALTRNELRSLSPERFDDWCAARLRERGYRVTTVAEQGVDLIAERESERLVVQCKRWFGTRPVGEPQLGDLYGAMQHEHANGAVVITTGTFSEPALLWAKGKPIQLWDVDRLMRTAQPNVKSEPRQEVDLAAS